MPKTIFQGSHLKLIEVLAAARRRAGLRQADLAARLGRDQSHISLIEGGQRRVDVIEFVSIADALGIDPNELLAEVLANMGPRSSPELSRP